MAAAFGGIAIILGTQVSVGASGDRRSWRFRARARCGRTVASVCVARVVGRGADALRQIDHIAKHSRCGECIFARVLSSDAANPNLGSGERAFCEGCNTGHRLATIRGSLSTACCGTHTVFDGGVDTIAVDVARVRCANVAVVAILLRMGAAGNRVAN